MKPSFARLTTMVMILIAIIGISSCSKSPDPPLVEKGIFLSGTAEKGPFNKGTKLTIHELDIQLKPTGRIFTTNIIDDKGSFEFTNIPLTGDFAQVNVEEGHYFDESTGRQSTAPISLDALVSIRDQHPFNVNILAQLELKRVQYLVQTEKLDFNAAKKQAIAELYKAFFVKTAALPTAEHISLSDGSDHAAILLGISAALLKASDSDSAKLAKLIQAIAEDLETDGKLNEALSNTFKNGLTRLNTDLIILNIKKKYQDSGLELKNFAIQDQFSIKIEGEIIQNEYFKTLEDFETFNNAIRLEMVRLSEDYFILEGLYAGSIANIVSENYTQFYRHRVTVSNPHNAALYSNHYRLINMINILIDRARKTNVKDAQHFQYVGYTYLALLYDQLINLWGDPVFVHPDNYEAIQKNPMVARSKTESVRTALINGLKTAVPQLKESDYGLGATILARLLRDGGLYAEARVQLDQLIQSGQYRLAEPSKVHTSIRPEGIFSWDFGAVGSIPRNSNAAWYTKGNSHHIVRYSEVLLISSEIDYHLGNFVSALEQINQIHKRDGGLTFFTSAESLWLAIVEVYGHDMKNEGQYFAALKRVGRAELELSTDKNKLLLPIPEQQLNQNPQLQQNPGY